ncbi:glycosyltransferase [Paenibacillus alvei]|uniref:Glycosyltransferase n=1 Tax=Paenibacillus alvei TaxID=44250 RepID=A0AAP7A132_PAEAL|nr:glycosyltransferase [Paenibacillus alvei]NOJ73713.1 glycosyltransferase [Paenibacillus alvei]
MKADPIVSIIIPSYNHGKYIGQAIESVLNQTYKDFELIIVDDCSPDNSVDIIKQYSDNRIKLFVNEKNEGAVYTTNRAIKLTSGKYIALLNSDDLWESNKLEMQVNFIESNQDIDAVFSNAKFINESQKELKKIEYFWADVFEKDNRTSAEWLRYFFFNFNCLCHPSILIKREIYDRTNLYDPSLRQLPDFKMWVNLLKSINIHVLPEKMVIFRVLDNGENASADTSANRIRTRNEIFLIMKDFFNDMSVETFKEGFGDLIINKDFSSMEQFMCEQAFMYLKMDSEVTYLYKLIALEKLHQLLSEEKTRNVLEKEYSYTYRDYFKMTGEYEILDSSQRTIANMVIDNTRKHLENKPSFYNLLKNIYRKMFPREK